jgi:type II secretory pathway pseudopilin PulG
MSEPRSGWQRIVEFATVAVLLSVVALVAAPRTGNASMGQREEAVRDGLTRLRTAIELFHADHGHYPGQCGNCSVETITAQLTGFTSSDGRAAARPDAEFRFGPYLRQGLPPNPLAIAPDATALYVYDGAEVPRVAPHAPDAAWIYCCSSGEIIANSPGEDASGLAYDRY